MSEAKAPFSDRFQGGERDGASWRNPTDQNFSHKHLKKVLILYRSTLGAYFMFACHCGYVLACY